MRTRLMIGLGSIAIMSAAVPPEARLSKLAFRFEECNGGATHGQARFVVKGSTFDLALAPVENWLTWTNPESRKSAAVHTKLVDASLKAQITAEDRLPGRASYFLGSPADWRADIAGYGRVRSRNVYPGIDLVFHGEDRELEYDFVVAPHADPRQIRLQMDGQQSLRIGKEGELIIATAAGELTWKRPSIYQSAAGSVIAIPGRFALNGSKTVRFEIGDYDRNLPLVIDPTLNYGTFIGGNRNGIARGIAVDAAGNVYIAGNTSSTNLPTKSAFQPNFGGTSVTQYGDAFVAKFDPSGTLIYLTYLGGSADDGATAIAVDASGNAYVVGATLSPNFPVAAAFQSTYGGAGGQGAIRTGDAFLTKLNSAGNQLMFSTFLGGRMDEVASAVALDASGSIFIVGATVSPNFPVSATAYQSTLKGGGGQPFNPDFGGPGWDPGDVFVAKFDSGGQMVASTLLGGSKDDVAFALALDSSGNVWVGGCTISIDFPVTSGAYQTKFAGFDLQNNFRNSGDAFFAKLDSALSKLLYSTYLGGNGDDLISGLFVDASGAVYVAGSTTSGDLKTTSHSAQPRYGGYYTLPFLVEQSFGDGFVGKFSPASSSFVYLTYLGGSQNDAIAAMALDAAGNVYVTGFTDSNDFPVTSAALQSKFGGDGGQALYEQYGDAFLSILDPSGGSLLYSSYYGGNLDDEGYGIALGTGGKVYITGNTVSTNLPVTQGAFQSKYSAGGKGAGAFSAGDAFYAVFSNLVSAGGPVITKVANAEGEVPVIAGNTWVEVKGIAVGAGNRIWQGSDFVNNLLPTSLDGISVTINGVPAYVYFISDGQINILTPPNIPAGSVQVQVTSNGAKSATFTVQSAAVSPSFFIFGAGPYVIAEHLAGAGGCAAGVAVCLVGPASLFPGSTTPAHAGETIVFFMNGFGATSVPVVSGALTQSGTLPTMPVFMIDNIPVTPSFAGLISPGLFQMNATLPGNLTPGDHSISASYGGATTQPGTLITIQ